VSFRSTNHRFFDAQLRVPAALESLEPVVRRLLKDHVTRGHVEVNVELERPGPAELQLDQKLLAAYVTTYQALRKEFGSASEPDLIALLRIPGMVVASSGEMSLEELDRVRQFLERATRAALDRLNAMRAHEGEALEQDLRARLRRLEELCKSVARLSRSVPQFYRQRLESRVRELLASVEIDGARLAQEVAYLASRSDITEELTRFQSHLEQVKRLLDESSEVGKKLDFLLQEMNREANTLLSKTTDVPEVGQEVARLGIEMKTEIEKLREQAQNIE
jgi:uncharacterized protein (TIGR00255 family)